MGTVSHLFLNRFEEDWFKLFTFGIGGGKPSEELYSQFKAYAFKRIEGEGLYIPKSWQNHTQSYNQITKLFVDFLNDCALGRI